MNSPVTSPSAVYPLFDSAALSVGFDQLHNWLHVVWKQEQNEQSVTEGCGQILQLQQKHQ